MFCFILSLVQTWPNSWLFKINWETKFHLDEELLDNGADSESFMDMIETAICNYNILLSSKTPLDAPNCKSGCMMVSESI